MTTRATSSVRRTLAMLSLTALATFLAPQDGNLHAGRAAAQATMTTTLNPNADGTVRVLVPFGNDGTSATLSVSSASIAGLERSLVRFDQGLIAAAVGTNVLVSATVELTVSGIATNWLGGRIGIHQMTKSWTEGGATWSCAADTFTGLVGDLFNNCATANRWGMDWLSWYPVPYEATPTDYANLVSTSGDTVAFDVTPDVTSFLAGEANHGWALIGTQDLISGSWVQFGSREHATRKPRLILTYAPPPPPPVPLGPPSRTDVFVTAADDIAGMNAAQIAERLAIPRSQSFTVMEFATPVEGLASPVLRTDPGFVGRGFTAGGAREFVLPNGPVPVGAATRVVR